MTDLTAVCDPNPCETFETAYAPAASALPQRFKLICGDAAEVLKALPDNFFDATFSDPPYGLSEQSTEDVAKCLAAWLAGEPYQHGKAGFSGANWDSWTPGPEIWREVKRVLKPGAWGIAFAGSRTQDLMGIGIRLAGLHSRDTLMYITAQGYPKGQNVGKMLGKATPGAEADAWLGHRTQLKPAYEPALVFQKPVDKTYANNARVHGCGGLNIDACRIGWPGGITPKVGTPEWGGPAKKLTVAPGQEGKTVEREAPNPAGRYPANVIFDEGAAAMLDAMTGTLTSGKGSKESGGMLMRANRPTGANGIYGKYAPTTTTLYGDSGGASRFFYCSKVSPTERSAGLPEGVQNKHLTLKNLSLTKYLASLLSLPPRTDGQPRRILVPFSGAGSEVIGALQAGWDEVWGIELSPEFVEVARHRIIHWTKATEITEG